MNKPESSLMGLILLALAAFTLNACSAKMISESGLKYARIGAEMPPVGTKNLKGHAVSDTLMEENEYSWRVSVVDYKEGKVFVEEDFFLKDVINRVRIETPELKLKNGLTVGNTVADLAKITDQWYIHPLPEYKVFDFYSQLLPRIHFIISQPGKMMEETDWEKYPISSFDQSAKISAIVVY